VIKLTFLIIIVDKSVSYCSADISYITKVAASVAKLLYSCLAVVIKNYSIIFKKEIDCKGYKIAKERSC